ncbi:MAG TPA: hypothetical protein VHO70_03630 [Chitinispirillaceae bacterium]|nr:hypothetical protein [Chitinispirillaceae bacterium]
MKKINNIKIIVILMVLIFLLILGYFKYSKSVIISKVLSEFISECEMDSTVIIIDTNFTKDLNYKKIEACLAKNSNRLSEFHIYYLGGDEKGDFTPKAQREIPNIRQHFNTNTNYKYLSINVCYGKQKYGIISLYYLALIPIFEFKEFYLPEGDMQIQTYNILFPVHHIISKTPKSICYDGYPSSKLF